MLPNESKLSQTATALDAACKGFQEAYAQHWKAFRRIHDDAKACSTGSFSVQDQQAAGCHGSEPLDQCRQKLFKWCMDVQHAADRQDFIKDTRQVIGATEQLPPKAQKYQGLAKMGLMLYGQ
jgi:hypothetical protein